MIKLIALIFTLQVALNASFFDELNLFKAQIEYKNKNYKLSLELYKKIEHKSNQIHYNMANILYKQKLYKKAILEYKNINSLELNHQKLHNIANCYIALNKLDMAIAFYKSALKFKDDKDTKFNLYLAIDIQNKQIEIKKKEEADKKTQEDEMLARVEKTIDNEFDDTSKSDEGSIRKEKKEAKRKSDNISNIKNKQQVEDIKNNKILDINGTKEKSITKIHLSDIEEDKWNKTLKNKTINTLLIPLENKGIENDKQPW